MGALGRPERLHAQPGHRRPHRARSDPSVPLGPAQHGLGGLHVDTRMVMTKLRLSVRMMMMKKRRGRMLGSAGGAEEHLEEKVFRELGLP